MLAHEIQMLQCRLSTSFPICLVKHVEIWSDLLHVRVHVKCWGKLPRVPWAAGYGPKLLDTTGSLQRYMAGGPYTPYQELTLPLQAKEMDPPI
jgi:hypothetical protein